jgi:hypothetical protein
MTLAAWLLSAMMAWLHMPGDDPSQAELARWVALYGESVDVTRARAEAIAEGLARVSAGDAERALELAAVAVLETKLQPWATDGRCNEPRWRALHPARPTCDGGRAWGPFQVHAGPGVDALAGHHVTTAELLTSVDVPWRLYLVHPEAWTTRLRALRAARKWAGAHPWLRRDETAALERKALTWSIQISP